MYAFHVLPAASTLSAMFGALTQHVVQSDVVPNVLAANQGEVVGQAGVGHGKVAFTQGS